MAETTETRRELLRLLEQSQEVASGWLARLSLERMQEGDTRPAEQERDCVRNVLDMVLDAADEIKRLDP